MELKRVLIISPYFPPSNAADMQRIRMSLPYFKEFGWQAEVVIVDQKYSEMVKDPLLLETIPKDITIYTVEAYSKKWTSKFGLGSLALRSIGFYRKKVDKILTQKKYDLIYFSTTQFPVCILGAYWKKRFGIPYVIDMQDPWHSTYYLDKPKDQRPAKYWFSYRLNKYLEPIAMKYVDGIISVSDAYISNLRARYENLKSTPMKTITFGYFKKDFEIARDKYNSSSPPLEKKSNLIYLVYIGRGGYDMQPAIKLLFVAFKEFLFNQALAKQFRFQFIGTSYAPKDQGIPSFLPIAAEIGISEYVEEYTNRISFYDSIKTLQSANGLIIPGSNDPGYTASKIYPYILANKPLLALFNSSSSAYHIIRECNAGHVIDLNDPDNVKSIQQFLSQFIESPTQKPDTKWQNFEQYSAKGMTEKQCTLFNSVVLRFDKLKVNFTGLK